MIDNRGGQQFPPVLVVKYKSKVGGIVCMTQREGEIGKEAKGDIEVQ